MVLLLGVVSVVHAEATVPGTDNNYATGDTITVTLTFSEAVTVTGTPYVVLDIGGQPRHAAYSGDGSSMAAQPFSYTVLPGDKDTDGVSLQANSLTLNGGAILTTSDSTAVTLIHSAMTFANHNVDNDITLVSNIDQTAATDHITISATESATVPFSLLTPDVDDPLDYTLTEIVLDVKTASPTLDVTINVSSTATDLGSQFDYVFSGSVANTGRQVFTIDDPYQLHARLKSVNLGSYTYVMTITGSGAGTVAIGATASSGQDTGSLAGWAIADPDPPTNTTVPRFSLQGHGHANPSITHAEIISEPEDGMSYKAGEQIAVLFVFNNFLSGTFPATADLWFGTGAAQRREASLVGQYAQGFFHHAVYAYTVQIGDQDTDGILLGENPLGRNADFALALEPSPFGVAPHVPADLTLSATQLGAGQLVDGSQERTCVDIACIQLTVESVVETNSHNSGFYLRSDDLPFEYRGALSSQTFSYKGTSASFLRVDVIEPLGEFIYCGIECVTISEPFLAMSTYPEISSVANRLGIVEVDGAVFHLSEANIGSGGVTFWWTNPGFEWSDGDIVQIRLIENATASFDMASYTADEGDSFDVTVTLSDSFENTRTLPVVVTPNGGATDADHSISPQELVFAPGETEKTFSVTLVDDTIDDDDETLTLSIDEPHIKSGGTNDTATVNITDNDDPEVAVQFGASAYSVPEGSTVEVTVTLDVDPERTVTVPLTVTDQDGASPEDYSGVPASVTFDAGQLSSSFTFSAAQDDVDDDNGESVKLTFGTLPARVSEGAVNESTVNIRDTPAGCESSDILCATVEYTDRFPSDAAGTKPLFWYHVDHDDQDMLEFVHNAFRYKVYTSSLGPNPGGGTYVMPPFHIPERSTARIGLGNLSATDPMGHWEMPNQDYLDWTLYISTNQDGATLEAKLAFNEAKFCCGHKWRWYGLDLYALNVAWAAGKEYQLRIVEDPRADRTPEVLGPPLYLEALGVNRGSALVRWVRPQVRNDGAPPGVRYKVQWKAAAGEWGTPAVSEHVYVPRPGKEVLSWSIRWLTPGSAYDVRVIAVNEAGDSAPSDVLRVNTDQAFLTSQNQAANSPATGGPGIMGRALAGETLTATTSGIEDEDGLADAVFAYQWIRQDLATLNDTDIEGAISSTYTVTAAAEGKAIQVRVTFTDDAGNPESVTSDAMAVAVGLRLGSATLDGATLTLTYNDTLDTFVTLPPAAFTVSVNGGSRSVNAVSVAGASVTLTLASAAQAGDTVTVDYAKPNGPDFIRDTQGRVAASFSGRAVSNDTPPPALTAAIHGAPESHDGQEDFTFELRFSEAPKTGFSDETLRDDAFRVTGGEVVGARQLDPPGKVSWEISVSPASSGDVNVVLPVTEDCDADGAICTDDGTMLSSPLEFTVSGPTSQQTSQQRQENTAATGSPTISGTVQVGQTLAASTTGITDPDGLTNASYSYQWIANDGTSDSDIADATVSAYTLVAGDAGKMIKVRVTFTDDAGNEETLTSVATVAVAPTVPGAPGILSVSVNDTGKLDVSWDAPDSNGGSAVTGYKVQWKESSDSWDTPAEVSETTVTGTSHTVTGLTDGVGYTFRVFAVNSAGDGSASDDASGTPRETTAPTVSSATVDGATLTLTFSEGLTETPLPAVTTFTVNVGDNRRGVDSVAISGSTVTLTLASAATSTDAVTVGYTVPSDAAAARLKDLSDNPAESFTGQAVTNNTAAAPPLLTASIHDEPSSHDGQSEFTFELQFSEEPKSGFSYKTMRDHAFTVTGGSVDGARRLVSGSNIEWQIKIRPTSNGDVTIVLPITEDCTADGAVCTGDGRPLSNRLEITVSGPGG